MGEKQRVGSRLVKLPELLDKVRKGTPRDELEEDV